MLLYRKRQLEKLWEEMESQGVNQLTPLRAQSIPW